MKNSMMIRIWSFLIVDGYQKHMDRELLWILAQILNKLAQNQAIVLALPETTFKWTSKSHLWSVNSWSTMLQVWFLKALSTKNVPHSISVQGLRKLQTTASHITVCSQPTKSGCPGSMWNTLWVQISKKILWRPSKIIRPWSRTL
jgi:hypothetical protein